MYLELYSVEISTIILHNLFVLKTIITDRFKPKQDIAVTHTNSADRRIVSQCLMNLFYICVEVAIAPRILPPLDLPFIAKFVSH